jgi:hypothetical protein
MTTDIGCHRGGSECGTALSYRATRLYPRSHRTRICRQRHSGPGTMRNGIGLLSLSALASSSSSYPSSSHFHTSLPVLTDIISAASGHTWRSVRYRREVIGSSPSRFLRWRLMHCEELLRRGYNLRNQPDRSTRHTTAGDCGYGNCAVWLSDASCS